MSRLLLCTDLDRTLLPNGPQPESAQARQLFGRLAAHPQVTLAYVTGRHQQLVEQAIQEYGLPSPDYVIGDVGSTIYQINDQHWHYQQAWEELINRDWRGNNAMQLHELFASVSDIRLQEQSKQNTHKLSYYVALDCDHQSIITAMQGILEQHSIAANLIWSIDHLAHTGLLDVLPGSAGKRQAIEFLMQQLNYTHAETVFAGDSGNDLCVLCSPVQSVLVANAEQDVRKEAIRQAQANHQTETLYLARGDFMQMNGNYSAGIVEGVVHYMPQAEHWLRGEA